MIKKIILIVVLIAVISGGTVVGLDKYNSKQLIEEAQKAEAEKEEYKKIEATTNEQINNKTVNKDSDVIVTTPTDPNHVVKEWRGMDGLTYKADAIKNANGTYTGEVVGFNMYDNFIEFNFKFVEITQRGFEDLLKK